MLRGIWRQCSGGVGASLTIWAMMELSWRLTPSSPPPRKEGAMELWKVLLWITLALACLPWELLAGR